MKRSFRLVFFSFPRLSKPASRGDVFSPLKGADLRVTVDRYQSAAAPCVDGRLPRRGDCAVDRVGGQRPADPLALVPFAQRAVEVPLLEDQDFWRLSGIFRDVYLYSAPRLHVRDFAVTTNLDAEYRDADLRVQVVLRNDDDQQRPAVVDDYLRACNELELSALRAVSLGTFDDADLESCLDRLASLKADLLEQHNAGMFADDRQFLDLVARIEGLQHSLPDLAARIARQQGATLPARPLCRKSG